MEALGGFSVIVFAVWIAPILLLLLIAMNKGRSKHFVWWVVGFSWLGFFISALIMLLGPTRAKPPLAPTPPRLDRRRPRPTPRP